MRGSTISSLNVLKIELWCFFLFVLRMQETIFSQNFSYRKQLNTLESLKRNKSEKVVHTYFDERTFSASTNRTLNSLEIIERNMC